MKLEEILNKLRARKFSGEVVAVQFAPDAKPVLVTKFLGYDDFETPIMQYQEKAFYEVALKNQKGEIQTFRMFGKVPELGSKQTYHSHQRVI